MQVSIIIPVYNAARFIAAAVESALSQPETAEIVLIEDGSSDNSLEICQQMTSNPIVKVLRHADGKNMGASRSRNTGIRNATMPFIAFLDADDIYLPGRFSVTARVFSEHPDADGVHEIIGAQYHEPSLKGKHIERTSGENTGIRIPVLPEDLFRILALGKYGHISPVALTVKREILEEQALFDTRLVMGEDSDFILRLSARHKLYSGDVSKIVALRGVHGMNSVFQNPRIMEYRKQYLQKCIDQHFYGSRDLVAQMHIITRRVGAGKFYAPFRRLGKLALPIKLIGIAGYLLLRPGVIADLIKPSSPQKQKTLM
jgi:glycosyltransferase involved in cell wall biosynthesis